MRPLPTDPDVVDDAFAWLAKTVREDLIADGVPEDALRVVFEADMRYVGQRWEVTAALPGAPATGDGGRQLQTIFEREYLRRYGPSAASSSSVVEVVTIRGVGIGRIGAPEAPPLKPITEGERRPATGGLVRLVHLRRTGPPAEISCFDGKDLAPGALVRGPALVDHGDATLWVPPDVEGVLARDRTLIMETRP